MTGEKGSWLTDARAAMDGPLLLLGVGVGAMSGISAVARVFCVGLVGVFHDFVDFYRGLVFPLYELVNLPNWPLHVPELSVDIFAICVVLVGMGLRAESLSFDWETQSRGTLDARAIARALLLIPVLSFNPVIMYVDGHPRTPEKFSRETVVQIRHLFRIGAFTFVLLPAAIVVFFLLNAYAPSLPSG